MTPKETLAKWIGDNAGNIDGGYLTEHRGLGAERIIQALDAAGFAVAPKEPTEDMVRAAHASTAGWLRLPGAHSALSQALFKHAHRYRAMIQSRTIGIMKGP